jgi:hypothetical protein
MGRIRAEQGPVDPPGWWRVGPWWVPGGGDMRQAGSGTLARGGASCWWVLPQRGSPGRAVAVARREGETNDGGRGREGRERDKRVEPQNCLHSLDESPPYIY